VTTSALIAEWLVSRKGAFAEEEAANAIASRVAALPQDLFIEPRLARDPRTMAILAVRRMAQLGILERFGDRYALAHKRVHPNFPNVEDIVAFQARFLGETLDGLYARASA
jgi:hypothetical protein